MCGRGGVLLILGWFVGGVVVVLLCVIGVEGEDCQCSLCVLVHGVGKFGWCVSLLWGVCLLVDAYGCPPDFDLSISVLIQSSDGGVPVLGGFLSQ